MTTFPGPHVSSRLSRGRAEAETEGNLHGNMTT